MWKYGRRSGLMVRGRVAGFAVSGSVRFMESFLFNMPGIVSKTYG